MAAATRVLLCAEEDWSEPLECFRASGFELQARASSGGEALAKHRRGDNDVVIIVGDLDGCHGSRIAKVLNLTRPVPTLIVCTEGHARDAQEAASARGGPGVKVLSLPTFRAELIVERLREVLGMPSLAVDPANDTASASWVDPGIADVGREHFDAVVLLGSAGTPNLLPRLLSRAVVRQAALIVAVHHNPRWSDAFSAWVGQLTGEPAVPWNGGPLSPRTVYVVRSEGDGEILRPNLGAVVKNLVGAGRRILALMASGMGDADVESLTMLRAAGGVLVTLRPSLCPHATMVESAMEAGLVDVLASIDELAWLIAHAKSLRRLRPVVVP